MTTLINYTIDGIKSSSVIAFFEMLRILMQFKSKKVTDYLEHELMSGVNVDGYFFKITIN